MKFNNTSKHKLVAEEIIEEVQDEREPAVKNIKVEMPPKKVGSDVKKNEAWNKSIGVMTKKPLVNLVKKITDTIVKGPDDDRGDVSGEKADRQIETPSTEQSSGESKATVNSSGGLSLLANYSGSDSDSQ